MIHTRMSTTLAAGTLASFTLDRGQVTLLLSASASPREVNMEAAELTEALTRALVRRAARRISA